MAAFAQIDPVRQLAAAESNLVEQFPDVAAAQIHTMVGDANRRFDAARVRDYIAILVFRHVRDQLRAMHARPAVA